MVESSTDFAIFSVSSDGATTSWNAGAERLFGYPENDIIGSSVEILFTPEDRASGVPEAERLRARLEGRAEDERWHQRRDGSRFWASGLMMPLRRGDGFVKIARDRTEQHEGEERLREQEERFRLLATSVPQLVFRTLPSGDRTWGSPQWIDFTGLNLEESLGFGWMDAIHPEDREPTRIAWTEAQRTQQYYMEHRVRRAADGDYRWHQTRARPIKPEIRTASDWVGTMTDVHDLRGLKDRQHVLIDELQHRTRNLLAVVQSIANQTIRTSSSLDAFSGEFGSRLRALSRVQGLLARADHEEIDLHTLVEEELAAHGEVGGRSGKIIIDGPAIALPALSAQTLALAIHELATNAVKYGALAQSSGSLSVTWNREEHAVSSRLSLEWRESGVAMPETGLPSRKGYGSSLIEQALPYQLGAETRLEFGPDGVRCLIAVPIPGDETVAAHG